VMLFVRSGWSVGFLANWALLCGIGWRSPKTTSDLFGTGFGWARPVGYGVAQPVHMGDFLSVSRDGELCAYTGFQLVIHPSLNPNVDTI